MLQNEIKNLTFKVCDLSIFDLFLFLKSFPMRDQTLTISTQKGCEEVLKFVACL